MAFPVVADTNTSAVNTAGTSHAVSLPPNISVGNLLLVFFATDGDNTITNWGGFTELFSESNGTAASLHIGYKIAVGSDTLTITTSESENSAHATYRITGHNTSQMPEVSTGQWGINDINPDPDSLTPTGGAKDYLWIAVEGNDDDDTVATWPTNFDGSNLEQIATNPGGCNIGVGTYSYNAATLDPGTFLLDAAEQWVACTVAVHPVAGAQTFYQNTGQGTTSPIGTLNKQGYKDTGGYALAIDGSLGTVATYPVSIGGHAMAIAGTLNSIVTFACGVGAYTMTIAGSLAKQTSKFPGGYAMTITGSLIRKTYKTMGGYAIAITGTLASATIFLQAVGNHTMAIAGNLAKKTTIFIGNGVISPVGSLARKTSVFMGKASISIVGSLSTAIMFLQNAGNGNISPAGTLGTIATYVCSVGGATMTISGNLIKKTSIFIGKAAMSITGALGRVFIAGGVVIRRGLTKLGMSLKL